MAPAFDLVFVISENNRGWILDAVCQEVARYFPGTSTMHYGLSPLPEGKSYFFSHWALFVECVRRQRPLRHATTLVFFTHPPSLGRLRNLRLVRSLNHATRILSMSSLHAEAMVRRGVSAERVEVAIPGADPTLFKGHHRATDGMVGLCSAYYPRKSPERILEIVRRMPHRQFLLLGRNWHQAMGTHGLQSLSNFSYVEADYGSYPRYYEQMSVFLSPSQLEGGPIPLLEAMMSNVVPVATRTGFAPDLVDHGRNGFLYDPGAGVEVACDLIDRAFTMETDVRATVEHLTWERYSRQVQDLL
jgi:glycosyltransferase involved in cell wall biosynthesis